MKSLSNRGLLTPFLLCLLCLALATRNTIAVDLYWDADGATSTATGGTGMWTSGSSTWRNGSSTGTLQTWIDNSNAIFGGTGGAVSFTGYFPTVGNITVDATSGTYTIGDSLISLANATTTLQINTDATITSNLHGLGSTIDKEGAGTLTLANSGNASSFAATIVNQGTLVLKGTGAFILPQNKDITISNGATISIQGNQSLQIENTGGTTTINAGSTLTMDVTANGTNNQLGDVALNGGALSATTTSKNAAGDFSIFGGITSTSTSTISANIQIDNSGHTLSTQVTSGTLTVSGVVSQLNNGPQYGVTKSGSGTLVMTNANTYTGATTISGGTVQLADGVGTSGTLAGAATVNTGGTLMLSGTNTSSAGATNTGAVTLNGGTVSLNSTTAQFLGSLTLSANSVIDFGSLSGTDKLEFADSHLNTWTGGTTLSIYDWTAGTDHLFFGSVTGQGLSTGQLGQIKFYSDNGSAFLGTANFDAGGEVDPISPVPEPSTLFVGLGLCSLVGYRERRWFLRCRGARQQKVTA